MGWMIPVMVASAQKQQDERLLAELIGIDTEDRYEFKVLRGHLGSFRRPERFQAILEEERCAQWEMVIKQDNESIVLRRPRRSQVYDTLSGSEIDPYRTQIDSSLVTPKVSAFPGLLVLGGLVAFLATSKAEVAVDGARWPRIAVAIVTGILMFLMLALKRNR
ncbi:MAG: hypothetical protein J7M39_02090 [Anaerolineae bacterium]|nr:hypothetical protein [Anaerolineae bacterium]